MIIPNYEISQELTGNDWCAILRGRRMDDLAPVLLKTPRRNPQSAADVELLEREFETLSELSIEGVPRVRELLRHNLPCCLVLEDRGGMPLRALLTPRSGNLDFFFKIAVQLTGILSELHRHKIVHRNINPRSVLVNPETGEVQLNDFSFAFRIAAQSQWPLGDQPSCDALPYISPEQTGRMNRITDYRTDFYSLGVTFYELLTGIRPFRSDDPLEIIHGHIAKTPRAPAEVEPKIPSVLSDIVMKLLSKNAEHRYQSALGLREDLETCAKQWAAQRRIDPFRLGERDVPDHFVISQRLYGRDREVEQLLSAFESVCDGGAAMMLVSGDAGIGKTSLIQELYKPIVRERGYFTSGKFDQVVRGVPFGALIEAFRGLVRQLLGESEERLTVWRNLLSAALGANGGVLAEVIPEIELILGKQPAPPILGPPEALNRFQLVFQNFVGALARPEHPLVVFLDDLQWADSATLSLFQPLLTTQDIQCLFLMGAYRDNDVDASHPLMRTLAAVEAAGGKLERVRLGPLRLEDLSQLIGDVLHGKPAYAEPLARLVLGKTAGNPFFATQFLKTLKNEGLLAFDYEQGRWRYSIDDISGAAMTDNVIDLMTRKIQQLSAKTQHVLTLASCIGNPFDEQTLAIVSQQAPEATAIDLREALNEGLILPASAERGSRIEGDLQSSILHLQSYVFLHDRMQQAAYALIPPERKQIVHLTVGRLLLERGDPGRGDEKLFDVVHHLNLGSSLIADDAERVALARLNLNAGRKAKSSTAYDAALDYLKAGSRLLNETEWESDYDLAFALHLEAGECQNLSGNFDEAEQEFELLLGRARTSLDKASVYSLRIVQYESQSRYEKAIATAREGLALFGVSFPDSEPENLAALEREIESIQSLLGGRRIDALIDLPVMTDPAIRMVMNILTTIWSSAYISGNQVLTRLISATMVRLSLVHGNSEESAYGYATHAITVGPLREDYEAAYEFGSLAMRVNERFNDSRRRAKICQQFQAHAILWRRPLQDCIPYAREASRSGFETGDFTYGIYGAYTETWVAMVITQNLAEFVRDYSPNLALFKKLKVASVGDAQKVLLNWARALQGETKAPLSLSDEEFDENEYVEAYGDNPFFLICYAVTKMQLCYVFGEYGKALEASRMGRGIIHHLEGTIWIPVFDFWYALTLAASYADASQDEQETYLGEMEEARRSFAILAENCPENFLVQSLLLSAEIERLAGRELSALELYERALAYAREIRMIQHQALANEMLAKFWLGRGQEMVAAVFLTEARSCYADWGAAAKVESLERNYHEVLNWRMSPSFGLETIETSAVDTVADSLDVATAMKAAQAIAREIDLEKLLRTLLSIAIENAGAERGSLLLEQDGQAFVRAEGTRETVDVKMSDAIPLDLATGLSKGIVNYVRRTFESVVLADAQTDDRSAADEYVIRRRPRSILCTPVLQQGRLVGALYLENNLVTDAFTTDRIKLMQLISSDAAISIENARLYDQMKREAESRRQAEETLRSIVEGTAAVTGGDFFSALVRHLASAIGVRYAFVTECTDQTKTRVRTLAFWSGESFADNIEYDLALTPCERVIGGQVCHHASGLQRLFPHDAPLVTMEAESFIGLPMYAASGDIIGHLVVIDVKPMPDASRSMSLLTIFAARAAAELLRLKAEQELRQAMAEVEQLKNRLHAENVYLQEEIRREHNFEEIVGNSPALLRVLADVERVAPTDSTVLINGETGTGKELIARAIHDRSSRRTHPLVKVNCGAISAGLVESELFGHVKGAFTGAFDKRVGRFELADGGTIFLDEVSELPQETQVKLLRVLQEGEFEPVGSSRTIRVNVRIIAATNRNLEEAVRAGRFRSDLFYRLNVFPVHVPSLRERSSDIPQLVAFFISRFVKKFGKKIEGVSQETMEILKSYRWPGNIRELQNIIERGVVLAQGPVLALDPGLLQGAAPAQRVASASAGSAAPAADLPSFGADSAVAENASANSPATLEEIERRHILSVLDQVRWIIEGARGAARILNLHPNTLRSRMKKLGIQRPPHEI